MTVGTFESARARRGRFRQINPLISCRQRCLQGVSKKERLTRRFPRGRFRGRNPTEIVLFCCLTKLCIIPPSMAVKKKTVQRSLDLTGNAEGTMTKYWAFARGGAWRNPKPTGGPYVCEQCRLDACGGKRQNPYPTGRHNDRAGRCGRVCRLRGAVVGGTRGQRSSMTTPDIGWHYSRMEGAVTLLSGGTHTSSVCTSWTTATRAHCE